MATQLFLRDALAPRSVAAELDDSLNGAAWVAVSRQLDTARGASAVQIQQGTVTGPVNPIGLVQGTPKTWISEVLAADITISGTITFNLRMAETAMAANCGAYCEVWWCKADGSAVLIVASARGVEMGTAEAAQNWTASPTSSAVKKGDRIAVVVCIDDAGGNMASGQTVTLWYNGPTSGASGDSFVTLTENLTFETTEPAGTTLYPTDTLYEIVPFGSTASLVSNFDGTDENPLSEGGVWSVLDTNDAGDMKRQFNTARPTSPTSAGRRYRNDASYGPGLDVYVTISVKPNDGTMLAIGARIAGEGGAGTWDGYALHFAPSGSGDDSFTLFRVTNASNNQILALTRELSAGDKIGLRFHDSRIRVYVNQGSGWEELGSVADTTYNVSGRIFIGGASIGAFDSLFAGAIVNTIYRQAWTSRGAGVQDDIVDTVSGRTSGVQLTNSAGGAVVDWFTRPLQAFTLSGLVKANIRARESAAAANVRLELEIARVDSDGSNPTVWSRWSTDELNSSSEQAIVIYLSGPNLSLSDGQRLRFRLYINDAHGNMASAHTATFYYAGTSGGASGDTYITLSQTVTEFVSGPQIIPGAAILAGEGVLSPAAHPIFMGSVALTGEGGISPQAQLTAMIAALLAGEGTLTASGGLLISGAALLDGEGNLTAAGLQIATALAALTGEGDIAAIGRLIAMAQALLAGEGTLTASAIAELLAQATLAGEGNLTASGGLLIVAAALLTGEGDITANGVTLTIILAAAALAGEGNLTASAILIQLAQALLAGEGTLTAIAIIQAYAAALLAGEGDIIAAGEVITAGIVNGAAVLDGEGFISATAQLIAMASALLAGEGNLTPSAIVITMASAVLAGEGVINASALNMLIAQALLAGEGNLTATAQLLAIAQALLAGEGFIIATPEGLELEAIIVKVFEATARVAKVSEATGETVKVTDPSNIRAVL